MSRRRDAAEVFTEVAAQHRRCVWLDGGGARGSLRDASSLGSSGQGSRGRSIIGWLEDDDVSLTYDAGRREVTRHADGVSVVVGDDPFVVLEAELAAGSPSDQWFGYFGYAARPDLPARPDPDLPDAIWMRPSTIRMFEHDALVSRLGASAPHTSTSGVVEVPHTTTSGVVEVPHTTTSGEPPLVEVPHTTTSGEPPLVEVPHTTTSGEPPLVEVRAKRASKPPADYADAFAQVQEHLHAGNSYEVNLTHRLRVASDIDPASAYLRLRTLNPAPYAGFLQHTVPGRPEASGWLLSSSPERYALVTADRILETKPIKGTTARGETPAEDEATRKRLATDPKFRSENLMIVDLLRNDLSQVCEVGSVEVPVLMDVESYTSVHQLVSTVRGRLRDDVTAVGALRALFPAGSMTGAPKLRTMEIIDAVEATPRGAYAGAFGWVSGDGRADLGVIIRTLLTAGPPDSGYLLGTGGGITVDSEVADEYAETRWKAERLLRALDP